MVLSDSQLEVRPAAADLHALADEQAALRRVAIFVARGEPPRAVFATVAEEVGRPLGADLTLIGRYDSGATVTGVAGWSRSGAPVATGVNVPLGGRNVTSLVCETGRPARIDSYAEASGAAADDARARGIASAVGAPIAVDGRVWGVMLVARTEAGVLPPETEERLAGFTELLATAIANAEAREALRRVADEQAALRRVATLVAQGVGPTDVFAAVTEEVGSLLGADATIVVRLDPDGGGTVVAHVGNHPDTMAVGTRWKLEPPLALATVLRTGRSARLDDYTGVGGAFADVIRTMGIRCSVATPIVVEGRLWGAIGVGTRHERFPPDTERRMADFTELLATAIANAETHAELTASRARIVATADETRRRIERDLHDGAQQQLVSLALQVRAAQASVPPELPELADELDRVASGLASAVDGLREMARGIHPAILSEGGLGPALATLARRSSIPVRLDVQTPERLPEGVEAAVYYVVSEGLTNAAKHANASVVDVAVDARGGTVRLVVGDDGVGGADPTRGSGLVGLKDRVEATGGTLTLRSRPGSGTQLVVELPIEAERSSSSAGPAPAGPPGSAPPEAAGPARGDRGSSGSARRKGGRPTASW